MTKISIVIPHKGRDSLLLWHLKELRNQVFDDFEIIVMLDMTIEESGSLAEQILIANPSQDITVAYSGGRGPNACRNKGAELAKSDIILILGSDCIPDIHLVAEHYYSHIFENADVTQGYSPFHLGVAAGRFYDFLEVSGLQAAWSNLKDDNGNFIREISPAFCLTTNYSIKKQLLLNERFDERFSSSAWDDIEFGHRLSKYNNALKTVFNYNAINYHYHQYNLDSFVQRCEMEGYHRLTICKIHPEMGGSMVNPFELRAAKVADGVGMLAWAKELDGVSVIEGESIEDLTEKRHQRYAEICKIYSLKGVVRRIEDEHPAMQALMHIHDTSTIIQVLSGVNALDSGHLGFAQHTKEWALAERPENWALWSFAGEVELECGNKEEAIAAFRKSLEIFPKAEWPRERLAEII